MTFTCKTAEWLDENRYRSYPLERGEWRRVASPESRLDCILLDATVFDPGCNGQCEMRLESVEVMSDHAEIRMSYCGVDFDIDISGGDDSGAGSYDMRRGGIRFPDGRFASMTLVFSSHAYMHKCVGEGRWTLHCPVMQTRIAGLTDGAGVSSLAVNGSARVEGHEPDLDGDGHVTPVKIAGDVVLEDGYRTSPVISRGRVLVRVGKRYGKNPCAYDFSGTGAVDCRSPLFFFCGQNAINGGNVILKGGKGVNVYQGRKYRVKTGSCAGKDVPCIEIVAGRELLDIYKPADAEQ